MTIKEKIKKLLPALIAVPIVIVIFNLIFSMNSTKSNQAKETTEHDDEINTIIYNYSWVLPGSDSVEQVTLTFDYDEDIAYLCSEPENICSEFMFNINSKNKLFINTMDNGSTVIKADIIELNEKNLVLYDVIEKDTITYFSKQKINLKLFTSDPFNSNSTKEESETP